MSTPSQQIDLLDLAIFKAIPSQTSPGDKRSLLAIHRATVQKHKNFNYLEIGSHLGGTIQPYLVDDRCKRAYSIDSRPSQQPDYRAPGYIYYYETNSSERMLAMLKGIGHGEIGKIECIDSDASEIDPARIRDTPEILFIDGEHTKAAALSDFRFCEQVAASSGTIVFHDFSIIYPAIVDVCRQLKRKHRRHIPLKLEDEVFAIFFDIDKIRMAPYLTSLYRKNRHFLRFFLLKQRVNQILPDPDFLNFFLVKDRVKQILPNPTLRAMRAVRIWLSKSAE